MKIVSMIGAALLVVVSSATFAQQVSMGTVVGINRLNNTVAIRQTQNGTVGANTGDAAEEFKVGSGVSLEALHAGDRVSFSASEAGGAKTITKIDRQ